MGNGGSAVRYLHIQRRSEALFGICSAQEELILCSYRGLPAVALVEEVSLNSALWDEEDDRRDMLPLSSPCELPETRAPSNYIHFQWVEDHGA